MTSERVHDTVPRLTYGGKVDSACMCKAMRFRGAVTDLHVHAVRMILTR